MIGKTLATFLLLNSAAQAQDLALQTRLEQRTLSALVDKTRVLLKNSAIDDHLTGLLDYKDELKFPLNDMIADPEYVKFRDVFSSIFKLDLTDAVIRVRIPKIGYQIDTLHATPISMSVADPTLDLKVTATIQGLVTNLNAGLDLDLMIPNQKTQTPESYLTAHVDPTTITIPDSVEPLSFGLEFETIRDQTFSYHLKGSDLSSLPDYVNRHFNDILIQDASKNTFSAKNISVNPVTVRLNTMTRTIQFDAFKPLLQKHLNKIIASIFSKIGQSLQTTIGPKILKTAFSSTTPSDLTIKNDSLYTRFVTSSFSQPVSDQLYLGVIGELCTAESFKLAHEQCTQQVQFPDPVRVISEEDRKKAKAEVTESLARGDSDLVLSLTEEYLNRLLSITIQADLWKDSLEKQHLTLGPKGAFIVLDERTQTPALYMDVLYHGDGKGGIESLLVNENKPIEFPLRISASLDFVNQAGIPHMVIKTQKILSDVEEVTHGVPEYGLESHLVFGLKKKIAHMILDMSASIEGQTAVDIDLPVLKNIDLEKTWHEASPFGQVNLFFKL